MVYGLNNMGTALSSQAKWSSPRGNFRKLEYLPENEHLLKGIIQFLGHINLEYPTLADVVFKEALAWNTSVFPDLFQSELGYVVDSSSVQSELKTDNQSHLILIKDEQSCKVKCLTLRQCNMVLKLSEKKQLQEVRACLEENPDPIECFLGAVCTKNGCPDYSIFKTLPSSTHGDSQAISQLMFLLQELDLALLQQSMESISKQKRLDPVAVEIEYSNLQLAVPNGYLKEISWSSVEMFSNGYRAPPWRQLHGDIAYITVSTTEGGVYSLTACVDGYYLNSGLNQGKLGYERQSEVFRSLVDFLKTKSPTFESKVNAQEFISRLPEADVGNDTRLVGTDDVDIEKSSVVDRKMVGNVNNERIGEVKASKDAGTGKSPERRSKRQAEQSEKWKALTCPEFGEDTTERSSQQKSISDSTVTQAEDGRAQNLSSEEQEQAFSESSSESEDEEETADRIHESNADLPSEYWQIQKLVKYLKGGNQTATVISLCAMRDFNLTQETCQLAIRDVGGLEVLINLLDTNELKCKIGSLKILKDISTNVQIRKAISDLGGLKTMVSILQSPNLELKCLAAETIANVAKFRRARRAVRQFGGIRKLVQLLDCGVVHPPNEDSVSVARAGALALWSCSKSTKNKVAIRKDGGIPLLARLLKSNNESMLIPVVGTLQECSSEPNYRLAIRTEGMIEDLVKNLKSENAELQRHCASAIFKCAEDRETRDLVRAHGGLHPLVGLLASVENKQLLAAATGAIWKCAISEENVLVFQELKAIELLVALLSEQPEEVLINVVGALGECAKIPANRAAIRKAAGISPLVSLLTGTNQQLLVNVTKAVGECATEAENMAIIDRQDGVRLLWSLLKSPNPEVQASAAWAICPCIENAKDAGEMVRSFVGGLELIVSLLKSTETEVLASVCAAIANIAKDEENLAVITDHGVVPMLARLTETIDDRLRHHLAEAIARCCAWGNNRVAFGKAGAVPPLVRYLKSKNPDVHRATAKALHQLSRDPDNCIAMHDSGVVKSLLAMVGSSDETLQEASAGCLANIRRLALANEKAKSS